MKGESDDKMEKADDLWNEYEQKSIFHRSREQVAMALWKYAKSLESDVMRLRGELWEEKAAKLEMLSALNFYADHETYGQIEFLGYCGLSDDLSEDDVGQKWPGKRARELMHKYDTELIDAARPAPPAEREKG